ncbi:MAG: PAS domain S-box protein [Chloroflexota bacterium]
MVRKSKPSEIRKRSEKITGKNLEERFKGMTIDDFANLVHELETNKVELELQNEKLHSIEVELARQNADLISVQEELRESRDRYTDLFDYSPVGYFTINERTQQITQVNLTACTLIGRQREKVLHTPFARYVDPEFADHFHTCSRKAITREKETCELKMLRKDGSAFWASLEVT